MKAPLPAVNPLRLLVFILMLLPLLVLLGLGFSGCGKAAICNIG